MRHRRLAQHLSLDRRMFWVWVSTLMLVPPRQAYHIKHQAPGEDHRRARPRNSAASATDILQFAEAGASDKDSVTARRPEWMNDGSSVE